MNSRMMLTLPVVIDGKLRCRLPLCDASALIVADVLVEGDRERRVLKLSEALIADPALAVWAILNCAVRPAEKVAIRPLVIEKLAINDLVVILAVELPWLLSYLTQESIVEVSDERHRRFAELIAE